MTAHSAPPRLLVRALYNLHRFLARQVDKLLPPQLARVDRPFGFMRTAMLGLAARHGLADQLATGPLSVEELARRIGTDADATHRLVRALASFGVFELRPDGR